MPFKIVVEDLRFHVNSLPSTDSRIKFQALFSLRNKIKIRKSSAAVVTGAGLQVGPTFPTIPTFPYFFLVLLLFPTIFLKMPYYAYFLVKKCLK